MAICLLTIAVGLNGAHFSAFQVNHIDIAPNHAGVMMGITNGFANLCGIAAPYTAGAINKHGVILIKFFYLLSGLANYLKNYFPLLNSRPWKAGE